MAANEFAPEESSELAEARRRGDPFGTGTSRLFASPLQAADPTRAAPTL